MSKHRTACSDSQKKCYAAATIVSDVLERLLRETARDGMVRVEEAVKILKLVGRGTYELDVAFEHQEKACRQDMQPGRDKASARNNPFRRLMVRPFETLLSGEPAPYPRPLLGNYFDVLEAAYGEKYGEYDRHSKALLQSLLVAHGHNLNWDTFYAEPRVGQIMAHALRRLLRFLETPNGQRAWLTSMSRPAPTGLRPSAQQTDSIREVLEHTLRGLDMPAATLRTAATA
ncbi:hypothetical protein CU669_03905 [Paramagnetospirillum kuznetsovii]|uniref:Uncharacterized protein n=1 Tax=Paramagnetospirillum kuznetsovii TaxID=2053833 RepID=A0A364P1S5_9PROT|nr:hypothetical protein [Paramagnetospirillum kuznetsovii]RAU23298.1 hypothetical protein CU669_03905 [Paramagnetospirillum kuznetsovii]